MGGGTIESAPRRGNLREPLKGREDVWSRVSR